MKKILVVEDDPVNAMMVFDYLQTHGYEVAVVMNGEDAVEKCVTLEPDLMIVDVLLPKKNGFNVCDEVTRLSNGSIQVLLMSAVYKDNHAHDYAANDLNAAGYLNKPFKMRELLRVVEVLLDNAA
jgi:DNA-binding response OmpR family regulator